MQKNKNKKIHLSPKACIYLASPSSYFLLTFFVLAYLETLVRSSVLSVQLTLRRVMDTAKQFTKSGNLNEFSMVLLNNTLSLPLGILLIFIFNEVDYLLTTWVFLINYPFFFFRIYFIMIFEIFVFRLAH